MNIASYFGFDFSCRGLLCVFVSHREGGRILRRGGVKVVASASLQWE